MSEKSSRVLLLGGTVINAGDFLYTEKAAEAFKTIVPEIVVEKGEVCFDYETEYLKNFDSIVIAGGPRYDDRLFNEEAIPVLKHISRIGSKLFFLSVGCYIDDESPRVVHNKIFSSHTLEMMRCIVNSGGGLSSRDYLSSFVLNRHGINTRTIGCTAFYDYEYLNNLQPRFNGKISNIVISDQGITKDNNCWDWKYDMVKQLIDEVLKYFPHSRFLFTFNGSINTKYSGDYNRRVCDLLNKYGIEYRDISGSSEGFNIYNDADLHVGFRMHSHIYCMSRRIPSILISEDGRGVGCNRTIGLPVIRDYSIIEGNSTTYDYELYHNPYLREQLQFYLDELLDSSFGLLSPAYYKMNYLYKNNFVPFIKHICYRD